MVVVVVVVVVVLVAVAAVVEAVEANTYIINVADDPIFIARSVPTTYEVVPDPLDCSAVWTALKRKAEKDDAREAAGGARMYGA
jgi:hypothetical protein